MCLDTCHVADAGYDIVGDLDGVLDEFDRVIGLDRLRALHLNDSKNPLGSHKDRHERIGAGALGLETLAAPWSRIRVLRACRWSSRRHSPGSTAGPRKIALLRRLAAGE